MRILTVLVFMLASVGFTSTGAAKSPKNVDQEVMASFYQMLESIAPTSPNMQIAELQTFIHESPEFQQAYQWLLKLYLIENELLEATHFFSGLSEQLLTAHNSKWMLAKIYSVQDSLDTAARLFRRACSFNEPSPEFLIDVLSFEKRLRLLGRDKSILDSSRWGAPTHELVEFLRNYVNLNFVRAQEQFEQLGSKQRGLLAVLYAGGYCSRRLQKSAKADSIWKIGVRSSREKDAREYLTKFLTGIGNILTSYDGERALAYYDSAHTIAIRIGDLHRMEYLAGNRALLYRDRGEFTRAEALLQDAIGLAKMLRSDRRLAIWYSHYGKLLNDIDRFDNALYCFDLSAKLARKAGNEKKVVESLVDIGDLCRALGHFELAMDYYRRANRLAAAKSLIEYERRALEGQGEIYFQTGAYGKAKSVFTHYIDSTANKGNFLRLRSHWFLTRARIHRVERQPRLAEDDFRQAYEYADALGNDYIKIWALIGLAEIELMLGHEHDAGARLNECLQISIAKNDSSTLPAIYRGLADVHKKSESWHTAINHYQAAASIIEVTRKGQHNPHIRQQYFSNSSKVYDGLMECYYNLHQETGQIGYLDSLFQVLERTRARALVELQRQRQQNVIDSAQVAAFRKVRNDLTRKQRTLRLQVRHRTADAVVDSLVSDIEISRSALIAQSLRVRDRPIVQEWQQPSLAALQQEADEREFGWLLYHLSEGAVFALVVTKSETKLVPLPGSATEIAQEVRALVSPFHQVNADNLEQTPFRANLAHRLYQQLVKPIEDAIYLPGSLVIVPDIELMNLPFEMLVTKAPDQEVYTPDEAPSYAKDFLQHRYAIVASPTTRLVASRSSWRLGERNMLVYANPLEESQQQADKLMASKDVTPAGYDPPNQSNLRTIRLRTGWALESLPFAQVEAEKIGAIAESAKIRTQAKALESSFVKEAGEYDVIHIASHGFADSTQDAFSGLVLSAGSDTTHDGLLLGYEIADLNLNCGLVTLSACETGRGRPLHGEGILGLPRLFLSAGAKSVLMTMWKVDDLFSSRLMPEFYRAYLPSNHSAGEALALARRTILREVNDTDNLHYQHPVFWAAYSLYGDPGQRQTNILWFVILGLLACGLLAASMFLQATRRRRDSLISRPNVN